VRVPGDKSVSHRALLFGALARGGLRVSGLSTGADVASTRAGLGAMGVTVRGEAGVGGDVDVLGFAGHGLAAPDGPLDCGNSGTTMRLLMGALAGQRFQTTLLGDASLSRRPMGRVASPLREMGAHIALSDAGTAPVHVEGTALHGIRYTLPVGSAQVKSAVLLAGLSARGETAVTDPFGSRDHTERMLEWLAVRGVERRGQTTVVSAAELVGDGRDVRVPADISSVAFWLGAASLVPGSALTLPMTGLNPGRTGVIDALRAMGADISVECASEEAGEPVGTVVVRHAPLSAARVPAEWVPRLVDEVPLLAVVATQARGTTILEGLDELRIKESDRLERIATCLRAMGGRVEIHGSDLHIDGPTPLHGTAIETAGDHRIAMAFAIAALAASGPVALDDDGCVDVSYPGFWDDLSRVQGRDPACTSSS
jgi:3-phosphoshikimate 1-carboxyvinyltransferase